MFKPILKTVSILLVSVLVICTAFLILFLQLQKPQYDGEQALHGLREEVKIIFDDYGVPHIYASNEEDAYFALGYAHAQDRLFQMEMIKRLASGRLAEVLGDDFLDTDKFFRTLGLHEQAERSKEKYFNETKTPYQKAALAYLTGVNRFVQFGSTPLEFHVMGIPKSAFQPEDVYLITGYMAFGFANGFKIDPILEDIRQRLGTDYLNSLKIHPDSGSLLVSDSVSPIAPLSQNDSSSLQALIADISTALDHIPTPLWEGSNGWVIGKDKSESGQVLLANDTHMDFGQPAIWYEAHLHYPGQNFYGNFIAGFPFAVLGHNEHSGWGLTIFANDDVDFFREKLNPGNADEVMYRGQWEPLEQRKEIFSIKGAPDQTMTVKSSRHGPLMHTAMEALKSEAQEAISVSWTFLKQPSRLLEVTYQLSHSQTMASTKAAASKINAPGLNILYGDKKGDIAWWAAAQLIRRPAHVDSKFFLNGHSGEDEYLGYYDFSRNPHSENPEEGYIFSANNPPQSTGGPVYPGYYRPEDRARRILDFLEGNRQWSLEAMKTITLDVTSPSSAAMAHTMVAAIREHMRKQEATEEGFEKGENLMTGLDLLEQWEGKQEMEDIAPSLYYNLLSWAVKYCVSDELGDRAMKNFPQSSLFQRSWPQLLQSDTAVWWDDLRTKRKERRGEVLLKAYKKALLTLSSRLGQDMEDWQWQKIHQLTHHHPLGKVGLLRPWFDVGPFPVPGGREVLNNMKFDVDTTSDFSVSGGAAVRRLIDFNDVTHTQSIIPTGQSGNVMSPHYDDQALLFAQGEFRTLWMEEKEVLSRRKGMLLLKPKDWSD